MTMSIVVIETGEVVQKMTAEEASSITTQIAVKLDAIADNLAAVMPLIRDALTRQAHTALGYASPGAYVADRFGGTLSRLSVDLRRQVVRELADAGLSTRAIAPVFEINQSTVIRDLRSGDAGASPADDTDDEDSNTDDQMTDAQLAGLAELIDREAHKDDEPNLTDEECEALADPADVEPDEVPEPERITGIDGKSYPKPEPRPLNRKPITDAFRDAAYDLGRRVTTLSNLAADDRFKRNADQLAERNLNELIRNRDALERVITLLST